MSWMIPSIRPAQLSRGACSKKKKKRKEREKNVSDRVVDCDSAHMWTEPKPSSESDVGPPRKQAWHAGGLPGLLHITPKLHPVHDTVHVLLIVRRIQKWSIG
jgi:hypothetical protein